MATKASRLALSSSNIDATGTVDSGTVDGLDSPQFLRSDAIDTFTGTYLSLNSTGYLRTDNSGYFTAQSGGSGFQFYNGAYNAVRMHITDAGNVGIGTTSPVALLDVSDSTSNEPQIRLTTATATNYLSIARDSSTGHYEFKSEETGSAISFHTDPDGTGSQNRLHIDRYGNIGIGTSSPNNYNNWSTITLNDVSGGEIDFEVGGTLKADFFANSDDMYLRHHSGNIRFYTGGSGTNDERIRIHSGGQVSIASTEATHGLNVGTSGTDFRGRFQGNNPYRLGLQNGINNLVWLGSPGSNAFRISNAAGSAVFDIDGSGNVGVGESSPGRALHITAAVPMIKLEDASGNYNEIGGSSGQVEIRADHGNTIGSSYIKMQVDGDERLRIEPGAIKTSSVSQIAMQPTNVTGLTLNYQLALPYGTTTGNATHYWLIAPASQREVRAIGRFYGIRTTGVSAPGAGIIDLIYFTPAGGSNYYGTIESTGLMSNYGFSKIDLVTLTYNSTSYVAIRMQPSNSWNTDYDNFVFQGILANTNGNIINTAEHTITNVAAFSPTNGDSVKQFMNTKVGIGTTDPSELLTINQGGVTGYIRMEGPSSGDYAGGLLMYRGSTVRGSIYTNPTHNMTILSENGINFRSNGGERFRIDHAQANMVHVQGDTADHSGTGGGSKGLSLATTGGTSCPLYFGTETNSAQKSMYMNGYWIYLRGHQNEGIRFVFSQGGGTAIRSDQYQFKYNSAYRPTGNTTWDGFSDARAKENVTNLTNALDTISQLRPVSFDWTDDYADTMNMFEMDTTDEKSYNHFSIKENGYDLDRKTSQIGFIAQEFEEVFPKSITETEMQLGDTKVEDFKTVNYDHLIPVLTKAIQEQQEMIEALKARIEVLEG